MFRTSNPALKDDVFQVYGADSSMAETRSNTMTVNGAINRTAILLCLCAGAAVFAWSLILPGSGAGAVAAPKVSPMLLVGGGAIGGLILAFITIFNPKASPITAPIYAVVEGLFVGGVSALYATQFAVNEDGQFTQNYGIVLNAVVLTFGVLGTMLIGYRTGIIKVTQRYQTLVVAGVGAVMLLYIVSMVMSLFGGSISFLHDGSPLAIGVSLVIIGIAALTLPMDFERIVQGERVGAPKYMEWYCGFGLLVGLVWLYLEILHLLAMLQGRD